jgi:hypothetical protein
MKESADLVTAAFKQQGFTLAPRAGAGRSAEAVS